MIQQLLATVPSTLAALGAWLAARKEPAKLTRLEVMLENVLDWQVTHERHHVRIEDKPVGGMQ